MSERGQEEAEIAWRESRERLAMTKTDQMPDRLHAVYDDYGCAWFDQSSQTTTEYVRLGRVQTLIEVLEKIRSASYFVKDAQTIGIPDSLSLSRIKILAKEALKQWEDEK